MAEQESEVITMENPGWAFFAGVAAGDKAATATREHAGSDLLTGLAYFWLQIGTELPALETEADRQLFIQGAALRQPEPEGIFINFHIKEDYASEQGELEIIERTLLNVAELVNEGTVRADLNQHDEGIVGTFTWQQ